VKNDRVKTTTLSQKKKLAGVHWLFSLLTHVLKVLSGICLWLSHWGIWGACYWVGRGRSV